MGAIGMPLSGAPGGGEAMSDVSLKMILWSAIRKSVKRGYSAATHSARPRDPKN
jgi:hypothetical protein